MTERPACADIPNPDVVFFPVPRESEPAPGPYPKMAKEICGRCPEKIRKGCLTTALKLGEQATGVWAGTTEQERRRLKAHR